MTLFVVWGIVAIVISAIYAFTDKVWRNSFRMTLVGMVSILAFLLLISAAMISDHQRISFFGDGYAIGTPLFFFCAIGLGYIVSHYARNKQKSGPVFLAILGGICLVTLVAFISMLLRKFFGFSSGTASYIFGLVSKWNDIGIYTTVLIISAVTAIRKFPLEGIGAVITYGVFGLALIMLAAVNLVYVWTGIFVVAAISLFFALKARKSGEQMNKRYLIVVGILTLVSLIFTLDNNFQLFNSKVAGFVTKTFDVSSVEVYPSLSSTLVVAESALSNSPLFGVGPGRFSDAWRMYRPQGVNLSQFWATDFTYGLGLWPTFLVTTGILGMIGILILIGVILSNAYKLYKKTDTPGVVSYINEVISFAVIASTLLFFVYSPGIGGTFMYIILVGIMIGLSYKNESTNSFEIKFLTKSNMLGLAVLIAVLIVSLGSMWVYASKIRGSYNYNSALTVPIDNVNSLYNISELLQNAFNADHRDIYARAQGKTLYTQFNNLLVSSSSSFTSEQFQGMLDTVINISGNAVIANPYNSQNYLFMGELFRALDSQGVSSANDQAKNLYTQSLVYEPNNPLTRVLLARLAIQNKDSEEAKKLLEEAVLLKPNYTEAVFLLSQLLIEEGGSKEAIAQLDARAKLAPAEPIVFFQLGFLKYAAKDYTGAIQALEPAVILAPDYSNALYFLGLSYYYSDRDAEAISLFERILVLNPESSDVATVLKNFKVGRAPFATTVVAPEKKKNLPVDETTKADEQ
jgi:tetratricopeptide (TPR) repeat protein